MPEEITCDSGRGVFPVFDVIRNKVQGSARIPFVRKGMFHQCGQEILDGSKVTQFPAQYFQKLYETVPRVSLGYEFKLQGPCQPVKKGY